MTFMAITELGGVQATSRAGLDFTLISEIGSEL